MLISHVRLSCFELRLEVHEFCLLVVERHLLLDHGSGVLRIEVCGDLLDGAPRVDLDGVRLFWEPLLTQRHLPLDYFFIDLGLQDEVLHLILNCIRLLRKELAALVQDDLLNNLFLEEV